ncbi:hypothetical protein [Streptomyces sp. NPDC089915]|uniref:hypothetical protein n=1 Tax=Streptomyces sp. NPDC089915 TaxID=3155186 RepID=UPI0034297291
MTRVTGLREENRELRRRQDTMLADVQESRAEVREEIQQLRELADLLRGFIPATASAAVPQLPTPEARADAGTGQDGIAETGEEGRIRASLSGRSLIAVLIELWNTRTTATVLEADWALAATAYNRIAAELAGATVAGETIRITLDDGLGHTGIDEG